MSKTSPKERILRFPRTDEKSRYIIVKVVSVGKRRLDLDLTATEGVEPYVASLRHGHVSDLKGNKGPADAEWEDILVSIFHEEAAADINAVASVDEAKSITLTIRRTVKSISSTLGSVTLEFTKDVDTIFDWCVVAIQAATYRKEQLAKSTKKVEVLEQQLKELKSQLDELIDTKKKDEVMLMEKFRDLLNEKKVKIRQQQKLLSAASVDPANLPEAEDTGKGHKAKDSRASKRKAQSRDPDTDDSSDGFDEMDVDAESTPAIAPPPGSDDEQTTEGSARSEAETASDSDPEPPAQRTRATRPTRSAPSQNTRPARSAPSQNTRQKGAEREEPPKRELPFASKKGARTRGQTPPAPTGNSETESDDEL